MAQHEAAVVVTDHVYDTIEETLKAIRMADLVVEMDMQLDRHNVTNRDVELKIMAQSLHFLRFTTDQPVCAVNEEYASDAHIFFSHFVNGYMTFVIVVLGIAANIYSVRVLRALRTGRALRIYLYNLAAWDSLLLASTVFFYSLREMWPGVQRWHKLVQFTKHANAMALTGMTASAWTLIVITLARHQAIMRPLHMANSLLNRQAGKVTFIIGVIALLFNLPTHFEIDTQRCFHLASRENRSEMIPSTLRLNHMYTFYYRLLAQTTLVTVGPFVAILVLALHTVRMLNEHANKRMNMSARSLTPSAPSSQRASRLAAAKHENATNLSLVLSAKFIICYSLTIVLNIIENTLGVYVFFFVYLVDVSNLMVVINSATNFFVYFRWRQITTLRKSARSKEMKCKDVVQSHVKPASSASVDQRQALLRDRIIVSEQVIKHHTPFNRVRELAVPISRSSSMKLSNRSETVRKNRSPLNRTRTADEIVDRLSMASLPVCDRTVVSGEIPTTHVMATTVV